MNKERNIEQKQSPLEGVVEELKSIVGDKISFEGRDINRVVREIFKSAASDEATERNTLYSVDFKDGGKLIVTRSRGNEDGLRPWQTMIYEVNAKGTKITMTQISEMGRANIVADEDVESPETWANRMRAKDQLDYMRKVLSELGAGEHTVEEFSD